MEESKSSWGGYREGSGNKYKWKHGETKAVRIPVAIADEVIRVAKLIDSGERISDNETVKQLRNIAKERGREIDQLKRDVENLRDSLQAKELELQLFKTMTLTSCDRPDLTKLKVYQPNRGNGLFKVDDVIELLDKHYGSGT